VRLFVGAGREEQGVGRSVDDRALAELERPQAVDGDRLVVCAPERPPTTNAASKPSVSATCCAAPPATESFVCEIATVESKACYGYTFRSYY
jgi:hypothetical protein